MSPTTQARAPDTSDGALLEVRDLSITFATPTGSVHAVTRLNLDVLEGEVFALVGESGSGKSVSALSIMGLLPRPAAEVTGSIKLNGRELTTLKTSAMNEIRGREVGMVFQDPMSSLNPVHRIGKQIGESLRLHFGEGRRSAKLKAIELLDRVGIPDAKNRVNDYPHEFSGGMRQRAVIAMALACDPKLLIADEPTTALDVTVQSQIVDLIKELQDERGMAVLWITHDLGVVAELADRVAVMYAGRIMETASAAEVYAHTRHPYTSGLLRSIPRLDRDIGTHLAEIPGSPTVVSEPLHGCAFHDRCPLGGDGCRDGLPDLASTDRPAHLTACIHHESMVEHGISWVDAKPIDSSNAAIVDEPIVTLRDLQVHFPMSRRGFKKSSVRAVDGVNLVVNKGQTLGLVGESGCGKTTLGRSMVGLVEPTGGTIEVMGERLDPRNRTQRRITQMIFQDPFSSMNPGMKVGDVIAEPMRIHKIHTGDAMKKRTSELLDLVELPVSAAMRYPHEFSGGQRQRIAVARALASEPEVIVCDEPVSALDVSVQAQIVNLLRDLQQEHNLAFVFIAHDLAVVRHISHVVAVMYLGQIVERAPRERLYASPQHPYTKALLNAVPVPDPSIDPGRRQLHGDLPSPSNPPAGCRFHTRCPVAVEGLCETTVPPLEQTDAGHWVACHLTSGAQPITISSSSMRTTIDPPQGATP